MMRPCWTHAKGAARRQIVDRRVLKYFLAVCTAGSITEAAERLFISRQALSLAIAGIEKELDTVLFVRSKHGVELTREGRAFYGYAQAEDGLWQQLQLELPGEQGRILRVGSLFNRLDGRTVERIIRYRRLHPSAQVEFVTSGGTKTLWSMLEDDDFDVAVSGRAPDNPGFEVIKVADCAIQFLMSDRNPLAGRDCVLFFSDLRGMTILAGAWETVDDLDEAANAAGASVRCIPPNLAHMYGELQPDCVYPIYDFEVQEYLRPGYVSKPVPDYPIHLGRFIVWRRDAEAAVASFARYLAGEGETAPTALRG